MRRPIAIILVSFLALLVGLCLLAVGGAYLVLRPRVESSLPPVASPASVLTPFPSPASTLLPGNGRLVVQDADGNIYTMLPDGADRAALTNDASDSRIFRQPAWSPAADRVAWVELAAGQDGVSGALLTSQPDGRGRTRTELGEYAPFYLSWRPDGQSVACLSNWQDGLALRLVDVTRSAADVSLLGQGSPFYFAWSPDSSRLLAHLDGARLAFLLPAGEEQPLTTPPGAFNAPDWSRDGKVLVYTVRSGNGLSQRLVVADAAGAVQQELSTLEGTISFALSPDGRQLAFVITDTEVPTAAFGPLYVIDLAGGNERQVSEGPVLGFFWRPDGRRLAYLGLGEERPAAPQASLRPTSGAEHGGPWLRWHVWDGARNVTLGQFLPSPTFLIDYLRFVDQYARSMTPWAPDGHALVFAGQLEDGTEGIWVQPVAHDAPPRRVSSGVYAAWSPR